MKILVVGGGGREHALCWKIASSPLVKAVLCAPGNPGTAQVAQNLAVDTTDLDGLVRAAREHAVDLVVVGPEEPLVRGLADRLRAAGVNVFGPGALGARLEGSKIFAKEVLERHRIPTALSRRFDRAGLAKSYLEAQKTWPQVIKADGLAAGKGVFVCQDAKSACSVVDTLMEERRLGDAGAEILVEEFLEGQELSIQAITDGRTLLLLDPVVDHKQLEDGDRGPNTGGMGVISPARWVSKRLLRQIEQRILLPTLHALQIEGLEFRGLLYAGLMVTESGPRVLEFNCRFGDPETQVIVRRFGGDLVPYLLAAAKGELETLEAPEGSDQVAVGVVASAHGYPNDVRKADSIAGLERAGKEEGVVVFQAGTRHLGAEVVTAGGRVLCVTALGRDVDEARRRAYAGMDRITFDGKHCRRDIGLRPDQVR